jgi:predicted dinucleotide-utilizing enzyme
LMLRSPSVEERRWLSPGLMSSSPGARGDLAPRPHAANVTYALVGVLDEWAQLAEQHRCRLLVPSGAIARLDGVKGGREGAITSVTMETRKPPRGLAGAPYIIAQRIDLDAIAEETLIFEGPATEAVKAFPANVNVVAALSLAGLGPERTRIKLYAVPGQEPKPAPHHRRR